ncbi:MAG: hypothetical protein ACRC8S_10515 [Fimbriiglobus sp.]
MQFIQPDILLAAKGLSFGAAGFLALVGFLLWSCGWRWHRFWVVFGITLGAGILGLSAGQSAGGGQQVLVVGVLLAVAAGMLALELAKILSFLSGGVASWVAVQMVFPQAQELWAMFLAGGLLGVVLYRLWTMLMTSFVGVLMTWHSLLAMAQETSNFDLKTWLGTHTLAINGAVLAVMLLGVYVQTRTSPKPPSEPEPEAEAAEPEPTRKAPEPTPAPAAKPWWKLTAKGV